MRINHLARRSFFTIHKGDKTNQNGSNVPGGTPQFGMKVGIGKTNAAIDLKPPGWRVQQYRGWFQWVIRGEFESSMVYTSIVRSVAEAFTRQEEVGVKKVAFFGSNKDALMDWIIFKILIFLLQTTDSR